MHNGHLRDHAGKLFYQIKKLPYRVQLKICHDLLLEIPQDEFCGETEAELNQVFNSLARIEQKIWRDEHEPKFIK
jgi:hypothetical protein